MSTFSHPITVCFNIFETNSFLEYLWYFVSLDKQYISSICYPVESYYEDIEAETKWLPCFRQHFQIRHLLRKCITNGPNDNTPALIKTWRRGKDKPLSEPMMAQLTDVYVSLGLDDQRSVSKSCSYTHNWPLLYISRFGSDDYTFYAWWKYSYTCIYATNEIIYFQLFRSGDRRCSNYIWVIDNFFAY